MAKASEFGGTGVQKSGVFPPPHVPTVSEQLMLTYRTGDPSGQTDPADDDGVTFAGLLPFEEQLALREAEGVMKKGEAWEQIIADAEAALRELQG